MSEKFSIPDARCNTPDCYENKARLGRMKSSWHLGVDHGHDGGKAVSFDEGLTWGSIGQILGYLLGDVDEEFQEELYERMYERLKQIDHGQPLK